MKRNDRKCTTQVTAPIEIPPLVFRNTGANSPPAKAAGYKDGSCFLNAQSSDQNSDFLKEKSLYRYAISRKGGKNYWSRSQTNLLAGRQQLNKASFITESSSFADSKQMKQMSVVSGHSNEVMAKQRHFRRKTHYEVEGVAFNKTIETPIIMKSKDELQKTTSTVSNPFKKIQRGRSRTRQVNEDQVEILRREINKLKEQNDCLREGYNKKCEQLDLMQLKVSALKMQNDKLLEEAKHHYNDSFFDESKLQNQIKIKDSIIVQLQNKLKYSELEIVMLKKLKIEQNSQAELISRLQKRNRNLEDRVDILTRMRTKRNNNMKTSMLSEFSDMSLNFSADDEEFDKPYLALKTAEKTPQKPKIMKRSICKEPLKEAELLTPLHAHKRK